MGDLKFLALSCGHYRENKNAKLETIIREVALRNLNGIFSPEFYQYLQRIAKSRKQDWLCYLMSAIDELLEIERRVACYLTQFAIVTISMVTRQLTPGLAPELDISQERLFWHRSDYERAMANFTGHLEVDPIWKRTLETSSPERFYLHQFCDKQGKLAKLRMQVSSRLAYSLIKASDPKTLFQIAFHKEVSCLPSGNTNSEMVVLLNRDYRYLGHVYALQQEPQKCLHVKEMKRSIVQVANGLGQRPTFDLVRHLLEATRKVAVEKGFTALFFFQAIHPLYSVHHHRGNLGKSQNKEQDEKRQERWWQSCEDFNRQCRWWPTEQSLLLPGIDQPVVKQGDIQVTGKD